jgi:VanZ family protein
VKPARAWGSGTLLAFYEPLSGRQFSLQQDYTDLALQRDIGGENYQTNLIVDNVFRRKQAFITLTSDGQDAAVYIDGNLVTRSSRFGLSLSDFGGQLILASSPLQSNRWSGEVRGLALYKSKLTADQVVRHYQHWTRKGRPDAGENELPLALYTLDEHAGKIIHNQVGSGNDLCIPDRYRVVNQTLLEPPWTEFQTQKTYLENALVNIAGFVPLGFCFGAYFTSVRRIKHGILATIVLGAIVSLTIEVLQAYLPTRDSGFTDLITNTLGTSAGVALYRAAALPLARALASTHCICYFDSSSELGGQKNRHGQQRICTCRD